MTHTAETLRVFLVGTEFFNPGGIQRMNRNLAQALGGESSGCPVTLEVFSYADAPSCCKAHPEIALRSSARNPLRLAASLAMRLVAAKPHIILFTHVALLKLVPLCRWLAPGASVAVLCHGVEVWEKAAAHLTKRLSGVDWVLSPSQFTLRRLLECHPVKKPRTLVIPHGLDRNWATGADSSIPLRAPRLLTVCRMTKDDARFGTKGIDLLLEAMVLARPRIPGLHLVIVGDGDDRARLESKRNQLHLHSCVDFAGALDEQALKEQYLQAKVFAMPSNMEGFGMVYLEAHAGGLPVIALNAAATPEVVQDGVTGILLKEHCPKLLADAIVTLFRDEDLLRSMSNAARQAAFARFSFEQFAARWRQWLLWAAPQQAYLLRHTSGFSQFWKRAHP